MRSRFVVGEGWDTRGEGEGGREGNHPVISPEKPKNLLLAQMLREGRKTRGGLGSRIDPTTPTDAYTCIVAAPAIASNAHPSYVRITMANYKDSVICTLDLSRNNVV